MSGIFSPDIALVGWFDDEFALGGEFDADFGTSRIASADLSDQNDTVVATGAISIAGSLAATEAAQVVPGAFWNGQYWATRFWANGYWVPNTAPNHVIVSASLAATETADIIALGSYWAPRFWATGYWSTSYWSTGSAASAAVRIGAVLSFAETADSLVATGTAAGGGVGSVSASLTVQEDGDSLVATALRTGVALPAGAVGWWPGPQAPSKRRVVAALAVVDGEDRAAVRVHAAHIARARLVESPDAGGSVAAVTSRAALKSFEAGDRIAARGTIDWSGVIAQEDEAFGFGQDGLLISELLREAA